MQDLERQLRDTKNDLYDAQTKIESLQAQLHDLKTNGKLENDDGHPDLLRSYRPLRPRTPLTLSTTTRLYEEK